VFGGGFGVPLTPEGLRNEDRFGIYALWDYVDTTRVDFQPGAAEAFIGVGDAMVAAARHGRGMAVAGDERLSQSLDQIELYGLLMAAQGHLVQALDVAEDYWTGEQSHGVLPDLDDPELRARLVPITRANIETTQQLISLFSGFPGNATLFGSSEVSYADTGDRDADLERLTRMVITMQKWVDDSTNIALGRPVTASSAMTGTHPAGAAVDGDPTTSWRPDTDAGQHLTVDLGAVADVSVVTIAWDDQRLPDEYVVEYATSPAGPWTSVAGTVRRTTTTESFSLSVGSQARYVRLSGMAHTGAGVGVAELEVYGVLLDPQPEGPPGVCLGTGSDQFGGAELDMDLWGASRHMQDAGHRVEDGALVWPTATAPIESAPLLLQPVRDGDWEVTTQVTLRPEICSGLREWCRGSGGGEDSRQRRTCVP